MRLQSLPSIPSETSTATSEQLSLLPASIRTDVHLCNLRTTPSLCSKRCCLPLRRACRPKEWCSCVGSCCLMPAMSLTVPLQCTAAGQQGPRHPARSLHVRYKTGPQDVAAQQASSGASSSAVSPKGRPPSHTTCSELRTMHETRSRGRQGMMCRSCSHRGQMRERLTPGRSATSSTLPLRTPGCTTGKPSYA